MTHAVAVDIGGTFTDLVAYDRTSGEVRYTKAPTTYDNFVSGILECFEKASISPATAAVVNHGTTLVINALIQRRGAKVALVTTRGFRDILEIARGNRPDPFDLHYRRDEPLIPRTHRFEVTERVGAQGEIVTPLALDELQELAARLRKDGVEAVGIFFMNSYVNSEHEEKAAAVRAAFDNAYNQRYGHSDPKAAIEMQTLHLSAFARLDRPALSALPRRAEAKAPTDSRKVHFGKAGLRDAAVYQRFSLKSGFTAQGPAVIEEYGSTTIVWPGDRFEIGALGEIRIHCTLG